MQYKDKKLLSNSDVYVALRKEYAVHDAYVEDKIEVRKISTSLSEDGNDNIC